MNEDFTPINSKSVSTSSVAVRYGIITGIVSIIYSLILFITELNFKQQALSWISFIILIGGIVMAHRHFKSENGGFMRYGQGLGIGSILSAVVGLLGGIFMYIYIKVIDSSFMERMKEMQIAELEKKNMSEEQMEQAMSMTEKFTGPEMMVVWSIVGTLLMGFLFSLIISAITKHTRPEFE